MFGLGKKRATFYAGNLGKITLAVRKGAVIGSGGAAHEEIIAGIAGPPVSFAKPRNAVCARHGSHERQTLMVIGSAVDMRNYQPYPFCPYCYGEWLESQFPVVEAIDAYS